MGKYPEFTPGFCIGAALMLMVVPLRWVLALATAAVFHEICHAAALKVCGIRIFGIRISMGGAEISTEPMTTGEEIICALAGPAGSLALLLLLRITPLIALFGLIQGLYNLLPVMPLDGGRVVRGILVWLCPERAESLMRFLHWIVTGQLILSGVAAILVLNRGYTAAAVLFFLAVKFLPGKIPCKDARKGVQ